MPRTVCARDIERQLKREAQRGEARRLNLGSMTFGTGPGDPSPVVVAAEKVPMPYQAGDGSYLLAKDWVDICTVDMAYPFAAVVRSRYRTGEKRKELAAAHATRNQLREREREHLQRDAAEEFGSRFFQAAKRSVSVAMGGSR